MVKKSSIAALIGLFIVTAVLPISAEAVEVVPTDFNHMHFAGGRLGAWTAIGGSTALNDSLKFSNSSFYAEFFYAHRITPALAAEFGVGIFSRGDFTYLVQQDILLGSVNIYPIMLSAKIYPFAGISHTALHPYVQAGGCLYYGRRTATDYYYGYAFTDESETKFTYLVGGGIDIAIAQQIGLTSNFKYIPVKFGSPLVGIRDYSGWQISVGIGYLFPKK